MVTGAPGFQKEVVTGNATRGTDQDRIDLFLERAALLRSSSAVPLIDETRATLRFDDPGNAGRVELEAPDDEATAAYFVRIREFDTPKKAIYVADFFPNLERNGSLRRLAVVQHLRQTHDDLGRRPHDWPRIVLGPDATPRDVWELWTYSHVLHVDAAKRAIWAGLGSLRQGMAKFIAYVYAGDLYHLVTVVEAMLRDPQLDDRGVRMQVLAIDPRLTGAGIEPFWAARARRAEE